MIAEISRGDFMEIGTRLARLRKEKGLTQAELAEQLFVSSKTVSKWENGYGYPDIESLPRIAAALGVDTDFLLTGKTKLVSAPEKKRDAEAPERDEGKKGVFRLYLWQATLNNFSFWIILLSVFSLLLAIIGGPLDFRTEDGSGTMTMLAFLYRSITDNVSIGGNADGWLIALTFAWLFFFLFLVVLFVWEIYLSLKGTNEYFLKQSIIRFVGTSFLFLAAFLYAIIFNKLQGEVVFVPNVLFALLFVCTFIQLLLNILVTKHNKPLKRLKGIAALGLCACILCSFVFCFVPRKIVADTLEESTLQIGDWDLQAFKKSGSSGTDHYTVESLLAICANVRIEQIAFVLRDEILSQVETIECSEKFVQTSYQGGAYYNFFEIGFSVCTEEGVPLPDFSGPLLLYGPKGEEVSYTLRQNSIQLLEEQGQEYGMLFGGATGLEGDVSDHEFDFYINRPITFKRVSELNDCSAIVYYSLGIYREEGYDKESGEPMYLQDSFSEQELFPKDGWLSVPVYLTKDRMAEGLTREGAVCLRFVVERTFSLRPNAYFVFETDVGEISISFRMENEFLIANYLTAR